MVFVEMDLSGMNLINIDLLAKFVHIQVLNISNNGLADLSVLGHLPHLTFLNAASNRINVLLDFKAPINLRIVNYNRNLLTVIPSMINFTTLTKLHLEHNNLKRIGAGLLNCIQLNYLSLAGNEIKVIDNIQTLPLRVLNLADNAIYELKNLKHLIYLEVLDLSHNKIKKLHGLEGHYYLHTLNLADNHITSTRELSLLGKLICLRKLDMQLNPVCIDKTYKNKLLFYQPSLLILDGKPITVEEKVQAISAINPPQELMAVKDRFLNSIYTFLQPLRVKECTPASKSSTFSMLILVGPLGTLKMKLAKRLVEECPYSWDRGLLHTTRNPREDEVDGDQFYFVSLRAFDNLAQSGHFIQTVSMYGEKYALSWDEVDRIAKKKLLFVSCMELEGVLSLMFTHFRLHLIMVYPNDRSIQLDRLKHLQSLTDSAAAEVLVRNQIYRIYYHNNPGAFAMYLNADNPELAFRELLQFATDLERQLNNEKDNRRSTFLEWKPSINFNPNNQIEVASLEFRQVNAGQALAHNRPHKLFPPKPLDPSESQEDVKESPLSEISL